MNTLLSYLYNPKEIELEANKKIMMLSAKVDSLALEVNRKDKYIHRFKEILDGSTPMKLDSESTKR
ncbi:MAG TPA: hypothetical protein VF691_12025 [Cytophagaceae bacterium]|jgi:hypothetical protein